MFLSAIQSEISSMYKDISRSVAIDEFLKQVKLRVGI